MLLTIDESAIGCFYDCNSVTQERTALLMLATTIRGRERIIIAFCALFTRESVSWPTLQRDEEKLTRPARVWSARPRIIRAVTN